jgi:hypothetical protein
LLTAYPAATAGAALYVLLAVTGLFITDSRAEWLTEAALLAPVLAAPALLRVERIRDLWTHRYRLIATILVATLVWDLVTPLTTGEREAFSEWPLVYSSSLLSFWAMYAAQAGLAGLIARRAARPAHIRRPR